MRHFILEECYLARRDHKTHKHVRGIISFCIKYEFKNSENVKFAFDENQNVVLFL